MRTRQVPDEIEIEPAPLPEEAATPSSREPVLIGDILFDTLADLARRGSPTHPLRLPSQRPHP
ncbi:hypothetical protein ABZW10_09965 [Kitasatospora sp. NPDC004723]|uniref:hypothetical protein n=1 Tax=Kitasatospora sp. NPDC004723 TaxID=3154288 RepID=UPI0033B6F3A3